MRTVGAWLGWAMETGDDYIGSTGTHDWAGQEETRETRASDKGL